MSFCGSNQYTRPTVEQTFCSKVRKCLTAGTGIDANLLSQGVIQATGVTPTLGNLLANAGQPYVTITDGTNRLMGGNATVNVATMTGATPSVAGTPGVVPAPGAGTDTRAFFADGTYKEISLAITTGNLLNDNTAVITTGTGRLIGGNATVSVPLRIGTGGTAVTLPTTAGGYQFQSSDNSIDISNPSAGVLNFSSKKYYLADTASTGENTATVNTNSSFTHYLTAFTANRVHILSTAGAVLGDEMTISIGYQGADVLPSAFQLEVRNATAGGTLIETFTDGNGSEGHYKFDGTKWVKVR